ncbi:unnamed protein product [Coccothraustes coccothraustes]
MRVNAPVHIFGCGVISSNANYSSDQKPLGARTGCLAQWRDLHGLPSRQDRARSLLPALTHAPSALPLCPSRFPRIRERMPVSPWECRCPGGGGDVSVGVPVPPVGAAGVCPRPAPVAMGTARPAPR